MSALAVLLLRHPYAVLFAATLLVQLGLPAPIAPLLLGAGALALQGKLGAAGAVASAVAAFAVAHLAWFIAGRRRGAAVLRLVCRISLEPDTCVRKTEDLFGRYGEKLLLVAPFLPGLALVAPPLAGLARMPLWRFALLDWTGALLWSGAYVSAGYLLGPQLAAALHLLRELSGSLGAGVFLLLAGYVGWKLIDRQRLLSDLRVARITAHELRRQLEAGEPIAVVDLRHALELESDRSTLPGALRIPFEELDVRHGEIPRDRDVALFCS